VVADVAREVEGMRVQVDGAKQADGLPDPDAFHGSDDECEDGDNYEAFEQERQLEILEEQDQALDGVFRTVGNLREQADAMGRELEEQGELLDSVDNIADRVGGKLQQGLKKVGWVIKNNEGQSRVLRNAIVVRRGLTMCCRHLVKLLHKCPHPGAHYPASIGHHPLRWNFGSATPHHLYFMDLVSCSDSLTANTPRCD
jgi:hypothetical protein